MLMTNSNVFANGVEDDDQEILEPADIHVNITNRDMSLFASAGASYEVRPQTSVTSDLINKLIASRSKVEQWVQHEKAKAEKEAEEYRQKLMHEKKSVDTKYANLLALQMQRGLAVSQSEEVKDHDNLKSIATQKQALEEQQTLLQSEIRKLDLECEIRKKRVQGECFKELLLLCHLNSSPAEMSMLVVF
jgi:hypothetical protein